MNVVIVGFGRVGSALAHELLSGGHAVTIIDNRAERVQRAVRLPGARVVAGNGLDVQVHREAEVGSADAFVAVTPHDNVNLVASQIAIDVFKVRHVMARVYTPSRVELSERRGILTVCPTRFTTDALGDKLRELAGQPVLSPSRARRVTRPRIETAKPPGESQLVVIAGGGHIGFHLTRSLVAAGHDVTLIERDPRLANDLSARLDCAIVAGDASLEAILDEAGARQCQVFAALTGRDEDNLIACQTVKAMTANNPTPTKTIARVSDPQNEELYRTLGADVTMSATSLIRNLIERELVR
jgi:Trk K+ transport system NAD-binding subunit